MNRHLQRIVGYYVKAWLIFLKHSKYNQAYIGSILPYKPTCACCWLCAHCGRREGGRAVHVNKDQSWDLKDLGCSNTHTHIQKHTHTASILRPTLCGGQSPPDEERVILFAFNSHSLFQQPRLGDRMTTKAVWPIRQTYCQLKAEASRADRHSSSPPFSHYVHASRSEEHTSELQSR